MTAQIPTLIGERKDMKNSRKIQTLVIYQGEEWDLLIKENEEMSIDEIRYVIEYISNCYLTFTKVVYFPNSLAI